MATSPYQYYNQILNAWPTTIALESQWYIYIDFSSVGVIRKNFNNINKYDNASGSDNNSTNYWNLPNQTIENLTSDKNQGQTDNLIGCVFARDVTVPSESVDASNRGLDYGGYQAPAVASHRDKYSKLSISFNETNSSFLDFVIRPWIVSVGYFGLVARDFSDDRSVKASLLDVLYLGKTGSKSPSIIRKKFRFFNVAPIRIDSMTNQYSSEGLKYSKVDFVYDNYCVIDPTNGEQQDTSISNNNNTSFTPVVPLQGTQGASISQHIPGYEVQKK